MKRIISAVVVLIGLAASASADMKACEDAWVRKNYETTVKVCRPLAERGNAARVRAGLKACGPAGPDSSGEKGPIWAKGIRPPDLRFP